MKKITSFLFLLLVGAMFTTTLAAAWTKMDLTKVGGGTINLNINKLELFEGKLYAATFDGIWVSPSANGGDWEAYGLQGQKVSHLCFGALKLANVQIVAADDATKTANKLYKYNGSSWALTNLNPTNTYLFNGVNISMAQIQDASDNTVIIYPTWGNGIWRSADGGDTWTNYAQEATVLGDGNAFKNVVSIRSFPGNTTLYGTDKVSNSANYMIKSTDYGATWSYSLVGTFFNPYSILVRKVNGAEYLYYGGQHGNAGIVWCSMDAATTWFGSSTMGVPYWEVRKIIGDDDGKVYTLNSITDVFVSQLNDVNAGWDMENFIYNETFASAGTGITIPATRVSPASGTYFLSDLVKSSTKLYCSAIMTEGIYMLDLTTSVPSINAEKLNISQNANKTELYVNTTVGAKISVYSLTGKMVQSSIATSSKQTVNIANLASSAYIVKSVSNNGKPFVGKFIK